MALNYGEHTPLWRRALGIERKPTWHDRHPLPDGWRPRTRIDDRGREVEPWGYSIWIGREVYDAGEWWLPVGFEPDEAAWTILGHWLSTDALMLDDRERAMTRCAARRAGYASAYGVSYAQEVMQRSLTARG